MERKEVIWQLKGLLLGELRTTTKERKALEYAISSLETDEAYQLEYEKPTTKDDHYKQNLQAYAHDFGVSEEQAEKELQVTTKNDLGVSSGLENVSSIIDWNNCHTSEQLDSISTTKNDLGVDWENYKDVDGNSLDDLILEVLQNNFDCGNTYGYKVADEIIGLLPSVTPQEPRIDFEELKRKILMEVDGGTDDAWLAYGEVCDSISNSINEFVADMREVEE